MSFLFIIDGRVVNPNAETLMISPFKEIWGRDKSKDKEFAIKEFAYIEFMTSMLKSNPYREYSEQKKESVLRKEIINDDSWIADSLIQQGIDKIVQFQTEGSITYSYWMANKIAIEKQIEFFKNIDIGERNERTGLPIYKAVDIPNAVSASEKALLTINSLKSKVEEEIYEKNKNKSDKTISPFAELNSIR